MYLVVEVVFYSDRRKQLPKTGYRPDATFNKNKDYWGITFIELPLTGFDILTLAHIQFTFQESHYQEVEPGQKFQIMEGPHQVGEGRIIGIEDGPK